MVLLMAYFLSFGCPKWAGSPAPYCNRAVPMAQGTKAFVFSFRSMNRTWFRGHVLGHRGHQPSLDGGGSPSGARTFRLEEDHSSRYANSAEAMKMPKRTKYLPRPGAWILPIPPLGRVFHPASRLTSSARHFAFVPLPGLQSILSGWRAEGHHSDSSAFLQAVADGCS
jgi:hypothetical protein